MNCFTFCLKKIYHIEITDALPTLTIFCALEGCHWRIMSLHLAVASIELHYANNMVMWHTAALTQV